MSGTFFTLLVFIGSLAAGFLGSLTGLGGGVIIIPLLTIVFGIDIHYAIGASLVSVIATSSGAASAYVKEGFSNLRIGMFLEVATTIGALSGAYLALKLQANAIALIFGLVLIYSAYLTAKPAQKNRKPEAQGRFEQILKLDGEYPTADGWKKYKAVNALPGFGVMYVAGAISGLLGIGSGAVKVLAMDRIMKLPFKVSTATSNFMIGVTAAASAGIYISRGYIDPGLAMPVMLGVLLGATIGARILFSAKTRVLKLVFSAVILLLALEMIRNALTGKAG